MPVVDEALVYLSTAILTAKNRGAVVLKIIHGYGSNGSPSKIKVAVRKELAELKRTRQITDFISGEDFNCFNERAMKFYAACTDVAKDHDWVSPNRGITIILL